MKDWTGFRAAVRSAARVGGVATTNHGRIEDVGVCFVRRTLLVNGVERWVVFVGGAQCYVTEQQWDELRADTRPFRRRASADFGLALHQTAVQVGNAMAPAMQQLAAELGRLSEELRAWLGRLSEDEAAELLKEVQSSPRPPADVAREWRARRRASTVPYHGVISPCGQVRMLTSVRGQRRGR